MSEVKKMKSTDGSIVYHLNGKMHNWDGPALIPEGNMRKREYYLNGIKYTEAEYTKRLKEREGLPWYKNASMKGTTRF